MLVSPHSPRNRSTIIAIGVLVALLSIGPAVGARPVAQSTPNPTAACPITPFAASEPNYEFTPTWHGGEGQWAGLDRNYAGRWYASANGRDGLKVMWWREVRGSLEIEGQRLDADAPPLSSRAPDGYGETGYQLGSLIFPTEGCWEVVGRVAETEIRFMVFVQPAEADPGPCAAPPPASEDVWAGIRRPWLPEPDGAFIATCDPQRPDSVPIYPAGAALDGKLHGGLAKGWWAIAPEYRGPVLIRGWRIDGDGELRFPYDGSQTELRLDGSGDGKDPAVPNPDGSDDPSWRYFGLQTTVPAAGCYSVQVDGWNFSALRVMPARM